MLLNVILRNYKLVFYSMFALLSLMLISQTINVNNGGTEVLGLTYVDSQGYVRNSFVNDNHNRCQNKLGVPVDGYFSTASEGIKNQIASAYKSGARWVEIKVTADNQEEAETKAIELGKAVDYANKLGVTPIIKLEGDGNSYFRGNMNTKIEGEFDFGIGIYDDGVAADNIAYFYSTIDQNTPDTARFIGEAAPSSFLKDGGDVGYGRAAVVSSEVRKRVSDQKNYNKSLLLANPAFSYTDTCDPEIFGGTCISFSDDFRLFNQAISFDTRFSKYVPDANYTMFDFILYNGQNYDKEFKLEQKDQNSDKMFSNVLEKGGPIEFLQRVEEEQQVFLRAIVMGYTIGQDSAAGDVQVVKDRLKHDFGKMSDSPYIEGIVFAQGVKPYADQDENFYRDMNLSGTNCNYDIVDYGYEYNSNSIAEACSTRVEDSAGSSEFKYICGNDGFCKASSLQTVQIGLPIRHLGSTSAIGTNTNTYMSRIPDLLATVPPIYDLSNQFGDKVTGRYGDYVMPWLGNANSISLALNYTGVVPLNSKNLRQDFSVGAYIGNSNQENTNDNFKRIAYDSTGIISAKDESVIYYSPFLGNIKSNVTKVDGYSDFVIGTGANLEEVNVCSGVGFVRSDPQNMIYGSEMVIDSTERILHKNILAYQTINGQLSGSVNYSINNNSNCRCADGGFITTGRIASGSCVLSAQQLTQFSCVAYRSGANTYEESNIVVEERLSSPAAYDVPGIYDTLASLYNYVQGYAAAQNRKILFNTEIGWEGKVITRSYYDGADYGIDFSLLNEASRRNNMLEVVNTNYNPIKEASINTDWPEEIVEEGTPTRVDNDSCKIGVNLAVPAGNTIELTNKLAEAGMGYSLALALIPEDRYNIQNFVLESCNAGITPVIRAACLGDNPNCGLNDGRVRGKLISDVMKDIGGACSDVGVYAICGTNEPVSEFGADFAGDAREAKACVNYVKQNYSGYGQDLKLITSSFNGTIDGAGNNIQAFKDAYGDGLTSDFSCYGINVYANSPAGATPTDNLRKYENVISDMPICITEAGFFEPANEDQGNVEAPKAIADLLNSSYNIDFILGFNWLDSNTFPTASGYDFKNYKLSDSVLSDIGKCAIDVGSSGKSSVRFDIPGEYLTSYSNLPADGDNMAVSNVYYPWLGVMDDISKYLDVYFESDVSEELSGAIADLPRCENVTDPNKTCLADYKTPASSEFQPDKLGEFLCSKGYEVITGECDNVCKFDYVSESSNAVGSIANPACPMVNDSCWQGPLGAATHYCAGGEPAFDLYGAAGQNILAPEDGIVVYVEPNEDYVCTAKTGIDFTEQLLFELNRDSQYGNPQAVLNRNGNFADLQSSGAAIGFLGDSGIYYRFRHIDISKVDIDGVVGSRFVGGEPFNFGNGNISLYIVPDNIYTPCWRGAHLHTWGKAGVNVASDRRGTGGSFVNMYDLYTDILGCSSTSSCPQDNSCDAPDWIDIVSSGNFCQAPIRRVRQDNLKGSKTYDSIEDLIEAVALSVSDNLSPIPAALLKAVMYKETSITSDITRQRYTGDPLEVAYVTPNSVTAAGPMAFTDGAWQKAMGFPAFTECLNDIGLNDYSLNLELRAHVGPALCAAAVKLTDDTNFSIGGNTLTIENWFSKVYRPQYARHERESGRELETDILVSPAYVSIYRYYGGCYYANYTRNYCKEAEELMFNFRSQFSQ